MCSSKQHRGHICITPHLESMANLGNDYYKIDNLEHRHITIKNMNHLLLKLEEEHEKMNDLLLYRELMVQKIKNDIVKKQKQITALRENLRHVKIVESSKIFEMLDKIQEDP